MQRFQRLAGSRFSRYGETRPGSHAGSAQVASPSRTLGMNPDPLHSQLPAGAPERYGPVAMLSHWSVFLLVVLVGVLGLLHDSWPKQTQAFWINVHAIAGLMLWFLLIARFSWRLAHRPPTLPAEVGAFSRRLSAPVHLTLYALMFVIP